MTLICCIVLAMTAFYAAATPFLPAKSLRIIDLPSHFAGQGLVGTVALIFVFNFIAIFSTDLRVLLAVVFLALALVMYLRTLRPFTPVQRSPKSGSKIKILQANVLKTNTDAAKLQKLVESENPDIIACCEVSAPMAVVLEKIYPHQRIVHDDSGYNVAVLSKLPFQSIEEMKPAGARATSITFKINGITFVALHTVTPIADIAARDAELAAHAERFKGVAPLVLMGDFNATPWCPAMKRLCAALKVRNAREGIGVVLTWPLWLPKVLRIPIDHVLVSEGIWVESFTTGTPTGSDHLPTITVITP